MDDNRIEYSNVGVEYRPTLQQGSMIQISIQIDGASYDQATFDFSLNQ